MATVDLPDHFALVTNATTPLVVQVTPYSAASPGLAVVERSTDRLVVRELGGGTGGYEFAYTVKGVRLGFDDEPVVRDATDGE